jgi:hypothetical protein
VVDVLGLGVEVDESFAQSVPFASISNRRPQKQKPWR